MARRNEEHQEQAALIKWARLSSRVEPRLRWLFAIPNGARVSRAQAGKLKAEGLTAGVSDLFLPVAAMQGGHVLHGLFVEMKSRTGVMSPAQIEFAEAAHAQGYGVKVCRSWTEAAGVIVRYLQLASGGTRLKAP